MCVYKSLTRVVNGWTYQSQDGNSVTFSVHIYGTYVNVGYVDNVSGQAERVIMCSCYL